MASFPGAKTHRESRRKLGRGQTIQQPGANISATASTVTVTFTLDRPCVIDGIVPVTTSSGVFVSQHITSSTQFEQVYTLTQAAATISIDLNCGAIRTFQGGGNNAFSKTF